MKKDEDVRLVELTKSDAYLTELSSKYSTSHFYDLSIYCGSGLWKIEFVLTSWGDAGKELQGEAIRRPC